MKKYYISSTDFINCYSLCWADDSHPIPEGAGWERIARRVAEYLCREEINRRRYNQACSGYAPVVIGPWWIDPCAEPVGDGCYMGFNPHTGRCVCWLQRTGCILDVIRGA